MTAEQTLEFRGIRIEHLMEYLLEIEAVQHTYEFPYVFQALGWNASILREKELRFTPVFIVNSVFIRFEAQTEELLKDTLTAYRKKTFRAGG
jgi:hypothetical protein